MNAPAIALVNPKFPHNVGAVVRAASCFGYRQVVVTGDRVPLTPSQGYRLPREERIQEYKQVAIERNDRFFEAFPKGTQFVAVEKRDNYQSLVNFRHPSNAVYVFGPEDGSLKRVENLNCQHFVYIPTAGPLNLAAAVNVVLYDRLVKAGQEIIAGAAMFEQLLRVSSKG